jgi:diaminopimelate decarboxylase
VGQGVLTPAASYRDPAPLFADAGLERGRDGLLRLGGVSLAAIADDLGTPAYVYNAAIIRERYRGLEAAFAGLPARIHYAVKSNSTLAVLGLLREMGAGADIVSAGELERARRAGIPAAEIVFSGVGKTAAELEAACAAGLGSINLESADELAALEAIVARRPSADPVRVGIRVNPDIPAETHPYISTGVEGHKFGVGMAAARAMGVRIGAHPRLELVTLAMHLGSQILDPAVFALGARRLLALRDDLAAQGVRSVRAIDVGGGFGVRYADETPLEPAALAAALRPVFEGAGLEVHLEPGRYLTASAGVLLSRVLYRKHSGGKEFVVVDAAMNDLLRPSHYEAHHAVVEVAAHGRAARRVDVVGPVCETGDFLALDHVLPEVLPGELVAILCTGSYGFVMASNYNSRPRPPEVLVDRGRFAVARPRERLDQLLDGEVLHPFAPKAP